jgi:hypothetical protein
MTNQATNLPGTDRTIHEEMEREKRRKCDEKAAETWRRVNEEKAAVASQFEFRT